MKYVYPTVNMLTFPPIMIVLGVHDLLGSFLIPVRNKIFTQDVFLLFLNIQRATPTVVQRDDMQAVEQLSFVLMDPLHLDVKHGVGVDLHLVVLFKMGGKLHFVLL